MNGGFRHHFFSPYISRINVFNIWNLSQAGHMLDVGMNAVSVNVSTYCDLENIYSNKFDPLIINTIPVEVQNLLPYCHDHHHLSDTALRYLLITLTHNKHFISSLCTLHTPYCRGTIMLVAGAGSYYCLCFQLEVIICYAVSPSAVSSLFINNITHILAPPSSQGTNKDSSPWWWEADESHQNILHHVLFA